MYEKLENLEQKFKVTEFPINVAIEITNYCNLNCIMCGNDKLTRPKGYMSIELYRKIIDEIAERNPNTRVWLDFYGEAMLVGYKLYYMIDYAKKKGLTNVCINTNGTLLKSEYSDMLLDSGVDYISLDCDGFSKEVYEAIRVGGNRDTFYSNVEYLLQEKRKRKSSVIVEVKVIEMDENKDEVDKIVSYWQKQGAWTAVRRMMTWSGTVGLENSKNVETDERIACGSLIGTCAITWDGNVTSCVWDADAEIVCGNINEASIYSIWQQRNEELVSIHMQHKWDELSDMCKNCPNWRIVGEMRYDEYGNEIIKSYNPNQKLF